MVIVHTESSLGWGGQELRILNEAEGMRARGHQVIILCPRESTIYNEASRRAIPTVALPIARKSLQGVYALWQWLRKRRVDVVNTHSSTDSWLTAIATRMLRHAAPLVRTRHVSAPVPLNFATRWLYTRSSKHIVTTSEALRRQLIEQNGYPPEAVSAVPTGIDSDHFTPGDALQARRALGLDPEKKIIGIVATLRSWKGHYFLIEAFARLSDNNTLLLIVGDGPQRAAISRHIAERRLNERIIMAGNQQDVLPWLRAMDIFVLPSYANEGVPQAVVQAMLCGLPVVSTALGGILEAIRHEQTGLIVEPKNSRQLHEAISRVLHDARLGQTLGAAARKLAQEKFDLETMLDKMERLFHEAIG